MTPIKITAFAGSLRAGSFNKKLLAAAADAARVAGAEVTIVDLRELELPLLDQDLEESSGLPEGAKRLKNLLCESDGMLIASPEYNSSVSSALKNALDWVSRSETDDEPDLLAFRGKTAALLAASPGALGGMRGLVALRSILGNLGVLVMPEQVTVSSAHAAFDEAGLLKDERKSRQVISLAQNFIQLTSRLRAN